MKLTMMSYTMARRREEFTLEGMFQLTCELELYGVDMVTLYNRPATALRKMADDYGVPIVCHTFMTDLNAPDASGRREGLEAVRRGVEAAVVLGAPVVMIPTPGKKGISREASRRNWIVGLRDALLIATDAGVTLTVENFPGAESPFVTASDLLEARREVPGLKVTYDNGNAATGEEPAQSFRDVADHVVHAHFKDWERRDVETEGFRKMLDGRWYKPALIGEGVVDHRACLKAMKESGYESCINIEYEGNKYSPTDAVRKAVDYLRSVIADLP